MFVLYVHMSINHVGFYLLFLYLLRVLGIFLNYLPVGERRFFFLGKSIHVKNSNMVFLFNIKLK
jgi:hypothetical protein